MQPILNRVTVYGCQGLSKPRGGKQGEVRLIIPGRLVLEISKEELEQKIERRLKIELWVSVIIFVISSGRNKKIDGL